ncbi:hypothetical protein Zmor_009256 [Zophobas morio]|uniref:Uncharacterized protein n=1 Tax=Zophobas morio TaxID=2755281 RepID=A0AA38IM87_9CUCU|nr:hypothetical protein Zmor_009256 [Zophobas morio]
MWRQPGREPVRLRVAAAGGGGSGEERIAGSWKDLIDLEVFLSSEGFNPHPWCSFDDDSSRASPPPLFAPKRPEYVVRKWQLRVTVNRG